MEALGDKAKAVASIEAIIGTLSADLRQGDHVLIMSNGGFGGLHGRLEEALSDSV